MIGLFGVRTFVHNKLFILSCQQKKWAYNCFLTHSITTASLFRQRGIKPAVFKI